MTERELMSVGVRHGTASGYGTHRCRCDLCRGWNLARKRRYNEANREKVRRENREAARTRDAKAAARKRKSEYLLETRPLARRYGYEWTGPELELAARQDLTVTEIAKMLGRSYAAVSSQRQRLRNDPRKIALAGCVPDPTPAEVGFVASDVEVAS